MKISKIIRFFKKNFKSPWGIVIVFERIHLLDGLADKAFIKLKWRAKMDYPLNLDKPQTFNEKLQWMKLNYHKPIFTTLADKYAVKQYISDKIGPEYVIPLLGVWDKPEDIDFNRLPNQFVLKCNHTSGIGLVICKDKSQLNIQSVIRELKRGLNDDYFKGNREWPYKDIDRKIIAEEYKEDESGYELKDYKLYCFNGEPYFCQVDFGKGEGETRQDFTRNIYDMNWNLMDIQYNHPNNSNRVISKPQQFEKMKELARILSKDEPFIRCDFYNIGEQILFSELTFYPIAGFGWFKPAEWDLTLGNMIELPRAINHEVLEDMGGVNLR